MNKERMDNVFSLETIVKNALWPVYSKDLDGNIVSCNAQYAKILGFDDPCSVIGKNIFDLVDHLEAEKIRNSDLEVIMADKSVAKEEVYRLSGKNYTVINHKSPLKDASGEIIGVYGVSLDITEQTQLYNKFSVKLSEKFYKASLTNFAEQEKDYSKAKTCLLSISVGGKNHEGERFRSTLRVVNKYFKNCTIALGDTLQRHTLALSNDQDATDDGLYNYSKQLGDEWLQRNKSIIEEELKIPYKVIRWDNWLNCESFEADYAGILDLYNTNKDFQIAINQTIDEFIARYNNRVDSVDKNKISKKSLEYLLEECAIILQWYDEGYDFEVYPSQRTSAMSKAGEFLRPGKYDCTLKMLGIRFEKKIPNAKIDLNQITLDNILKTLPGHVYWKGKNGVYRGCNLKQAHTYKLHDINALIGKSDFDILEEDVAMAIRKNDLEVMKSGRTEVVEENAYIFGKNYTFLSHKTPLKDADNNVVGILGVSLDITKQKEAELKLSEQNHQLIHAMQTKRRFLNNISHEIKTPLSCLLKISKAIYEDWEKYPNNDARKAHLKIAVEGSERLKNVLANLLDLSVTENGKMNYDMRKYSLRKSVEDVIGEFIEHKHRIHTFFDNTSNYTLIYDHYRIEQVIRNLLANAISYGGNHDIIISLRNAGDYFIFDIKDHGIGIPQEELEDIFKIFTRSSRTSERSGTGIGLSISKSIIEDHGGIIWAENNIDQLGSRFTFKLPTQKHKLEALTEHEDKKQTIIIPAEAPASARPILLVIDDEESVLQVSKIIFERLGFNVLTASSGTEGLRFLLDYNTKISVVLLDMMMPDIHGLSLLEMIKKHPSLDQIPIFIYSGISSNEEVTKCLKLGALEFIEKTSSTEKMAILLSPYLSKTTIKSSSASSH